MRMDNGSMKNLNLTREQEDEICARIGAWYNYWKLSMTSNGLLHSLGSAKEDLKTLLCDSLIDEEDIGLILQKKYVHKELGVELPK